MDPRGAGMSALPAAAYLTDFGGAGGARNPALALVAGAGDKALSPAATAERAFAEGVESGKAAAAAALEARLQEQKALYEARLAEARGMWSAEEGRRLAEGLRAGLEAMEAALAQATARVLEPFLGEEVRRQAIAELGRQLHALVAKDASLGLRITGPADLLEAMRATLADSIAGVVYQPAEACELRVEAGPSVLETRLAPWLAAIREAIR
jgi:hypothetical protein